MSRHFFRQWKMESVKINDKGYKHYRLNFNAAGTLQVIAIQIDTKAEQCAAADDIRL